MIIEVSYRGIVGTKMIEKMEKLGTGLGIYYHRRVLEIVTTSQGLTSSKNQGRWHQRTNPKTNSSKEPREGVDLR